MRDAFGGVFMIRLLLVFLFIYVSFTAVSLNYAKAFRIKNKVIDLIEQEEILDLKAYYQKGSGSGLAKLDKILSNANYNKTCTNGNGELSRKDGEPYAICYKGIVIEETGTTNNYKNYKVYTYANWNLGTLNMIFRLGGQSENSGDIVSGAWEITGDAKVRIRK